MAGIFKNNDIRGTYGQDLTDLIALKIGFLFGEKIGRGKQVVIGGDTRISTPKLKEAITRGLSLSGNHVHDVGVVPTPAIYYIACTEPEIDQGIIITGSHNPSDQNGIKICDHRGAAYDYDNMFGYLEDMVSNLQHNPEEGFTGDIGEIHLESPLKDRYYQYLFQELEGLERNLVIGVEVGGGATFEFVNLLDQLGHEVIAYGNRTKQELGENPPDPTKPHTFQKLQELTGLRSIDIGIAFDTDGDRVGFITPSGTIIPPDKVIMLFGKQVLSTAEDSRIIIDVKISKATAEYLESRGAIMELTKVGHSYIHEKLLDINAKMAAELSGHYYFHDRYHGFDDGLYAAVRFLQLVDQLQIDDKDLDDVVSELPEYASTMEFRDHIPFAKQENILEQLEAYAREHDAKIVKIDGIRAEFDNGWFIARQSGTEEVLSYRIEGETEQDKQLLLESVRQIISSH